VLQVNIEESSNTAILRCVGRMVRGHEGTLLCAALRPQGGNIILDLSQVDAIDAAGVGALISLQAAGIYLQLMNPSKAVRDVLRVTKLDSIFEISRGAPAESHKEELGWKASLVPFLPRVVATAS
jgi:anti-anti-sigma factor